MRTLMSLDESARPPMDGHDEVHAPVLPEEVAALLGGGAADTDAGGWIVDATLGAGGHSALLLERLGEVRVFGADQDPEILGLARRRLERFGERARVERCRLSMLSRALRKLRCERPVGWLMDVGASSLQLDRPTRGFSFQVDGPLDMRMDPERERTAAEIVNSWDEEDLADLLYHEGGERRSRAVAAAIVAARRRAPFLRTGALAELVSHVLGPGGKIHPATRTFQALRRAVNEEGDELLAGLAAAETWLADRGVLVVISFHSGEDAVVKRFLADGARAGRWEVLTRRPMQASQAEVRENPRSRSARLRAARRLRAADEPQTPALNTAAQGSHGVLGEIEEGGRP